MFDQGILQSSEKIHLKNEFPQGLFIGGMLTGLDN